MGDSTPSGFIPPVFLKQSDLRDVIGNKRLSVYEMCLIVADVVTEACVDGCQPMRGLWRIYATTPEARQKLINEGLTVNSISLSLYSSNPFSTGISDPEQDVVKITIKDLPLSYSNEDIGRTLTQMGAELTSDVKYGYVRDQKNHVTKFKSGDRFVYADNEHMKSNPLPRFHIIGSFQCRIFHDGQAQNQKVCTNCFGDDHFTSRCQNPRACKVCHLPGHCEGQPGCKYYEPQVDVHPFGGRFDELSNHYMHNFKHNDIIVKSSEHAYMYEKAMRNGMPDLAHKILDCKSAAAAKALGKYVICDSSWDESNLTVLEDINREKVQQISAVRSALLHTGEKIIAEAVPNPSDKIYGTSLDKDATFHTKKEKWPGKNMMGKIWMKIRADVVKTRKSPGREEHPSQNENANKKQQKKTEGKAKKHQQRQSDPKRKLSPNSANACSSPARKLKTDKNDNKGQMTIHQAFKNQSDLDSEVSGDEASWSDSTLRDSSEQLSFSYEPSSQRYDGFY